MRRTTSFLALGSLLMAAACSSASTSDDRDHDGLEPGDGDGDASGGDGGTSGEDPCDSFEDRYGDLVQIEISKPDFRADLLGPRLSDDRYLQ